jgi:membrane protease YdiL (CAAX protease family)
MESAGLSEDVSLLMMLYSVCLAPISEELIFRGVTYRIARRAFPFWIANFIQALLFGIFHMNPLQGCYTFILGLFMGYICEKGGTLYHAIFFHFLFNLWGTTASEWLLAGDEATQGLIIMVGTIVGLSGGLYFFKKGNKAKL